MGRAVGIRDVARAAGVSVGTVSNVINRPESVAAPTRARVRSAIDRLGYVRSESARQLRAGRSRMISLLVLDIANPFFVDVAAGAERSARAAGLLRHVETARMDVASGRDAGARLLGMAPRPTAVFCANDLLALGVLQTLYGAGAAVPDDVALIGYDDIGCAQAAAVPLTSVRRPAVHMGRTAASLLIEETGGAAAAHRHRRMVLRPELVVRASTVGHRRRAAEAAARAGGPSA